MINGSSIVTESISGKRKAVLHAREPFMSRLHRYDRDQIIHTICNMEQEHTLFGSSGRSAVHELVSPIKAIDERYILSLRFKGITPVIKNGVIPEHRGNGFVENPIMVDENGYVRQIHVVKGDPEGGMFQEDAKTEFDVAIARESDTTDIAIAYGEYPDLHYEYEGRTRTLGFAVIGQETARDIRFGIDFIAPHVIPDANKIYNSQFLFHKDLFRFSNLFGQAMHRFHSQGANASEEGFVSRYPHFDNIGIHFRYSMDDLDSYPDARAVIRDLDTALRLKDLTPKQRYGYIFLDLAQISMRYVREAKADRIIDLKYNLGHLLPSFFQGYFGDRLQGVSLGISNDFWYPTLDRELSDFEKAALMLKDCYLNENVYQPQTLLAQSNNPFLKFMHSYLLEASGQAA